MAPTFNELLGSAGIDPAGVCLLRHQTDKGVPGRTPYTLWRDDLNGFERYQSTQRRRPIFRDSPFWAAFVAPAKTETLFVGIYETELEATGTIDWLDPLTDRPVGADSPGPVDLFRYRLADQLREHIGRLKVDWDLRAARTWAQYAIRHDKTIIAATTRSSAVLPASSEGRRIWSLQKSLERNPKFRHAALQMNLGRYGKPTCEACAFSNRDQGLFDVHHPNPLVLGERETQVEELEVLCPLCHRRAHRKNRFQPFSLGELRDWVGRGRP